jgi:alpha-1,3-glucosyltransferase
MQSWLCGKFMELFSPETVELGASQGYESAFSKLLMRWTVMLSDVSRESLPRLK